LGRQRERDAWRFRGPFDLPVKLGVKRGKEGYFGLFFSNFNLKEKIKV
jgi:hypothetical protein